MHVSKIKNIVDKIFKKRQNRKKIF